MQKLIDANIAPVVFYDMEKSPPRVSFPYIGNGKNEHACLVVGYYKTPYDETRFIISQFQKFYDFDGMELALSACHSLAEVREQETYSKRLDLKSNKTFWLLASIEDDPAEYVTIRNTPLRTSLPMQPTDHSLKGKIVAITGLCNPQSNLGVGKNI